jgi:hypothetical protein
MNINDVLHKGYESSSAIRDWDRFAPVATCQNATIRALSTRINTRSVNRMSDKEQDELFLFELFSKHCPLTIAKFKHRAEPEPDILCTLDDGQQIAFELTEVLDPKHKEFTVSARRLQELLDREIEKLAKPELFHGYSVLVDFKDDTSYRKRPKYVNQVAAILNANGPKNRLPITDRGKAVGVIVCHQNNLDAPCHFRASNAGNYGYYDVEAVTIKCSKKKYTTPHKKHLLVYARRAWKDNLDEVKQVFDQQNNFSHLWIFDTTEKKIVLSIGK